MPEIKFFDDILRQAMEVCAWQRKDKTYELGEEGWFEVLEYLQEYRTDSGFKVN